MVDDIILYDLYLDDVYDLIDMEGNVFKRIVLLTNAQSN